MTDGAWAWALCPWCGTAHKKMSKSTDEIKFRCSECGATWDDLGCETREEAESYRDVSVYGSGSKGGDV